MILHIQLFTKKTIYYIWIQYFYSVSNINLFFIVTFYSNSSIFMLFNKFLLGFEYFYSNLNISILTEILLCSLVTLDLSSNIFMLFEKLLFWLLVQFA